MGGWDGGSSPILPRAPLPRARTHTHTHMWLHISPFSARNHFFRLFFFHLLPTLSDARTHTHARSLSLPPLPFTPSRSRSVECETCSYGGGNAPPKYFIVMDSKGMTNKEMSGEAGVAGWGCFDEVLL